MRNVCSSFRFQDAYVTLSEYWSRIQWKTGAPYTASFKCQNYNLWLFTSTATMATKLAATCAAAVARAVKS